MTPAPQPPGTSGDGEYRITESELYSACHGGLQSWQERSVRSRHIALAPLSEIDAPSQLEGNYWTCPFRNDCELASICLWPCNRWAEQHDAAIRKDEREKVLKDIRDFLHEWEQ